MKTNNTQNRARRLSGSVRIDNFLTRVYRAVSEIAFQEEDVATQGSGKQAILVLDASGSMEENDWKPSRLSGAQQSALAYCERLAVEEPDAFVAIVAYGSEAKVMCKLTPVVRIKKIEQAINRIDYLGSTNIKAGLTTAYNLLKKTTSNAQVVLLTDGHNTDRSPIDIAKKLQKQAIIECVGIGGSPSDVDEKLLRKIASERDDGTKRY